MAINRFINAHPQLSLPSFKETARVLQSTKENIGDLLLAPSQGASSQGIAIHDALFFDKKYRKKMTNMNNIKIDAIIHLVRNPFDQALSWINHINACACLGILGWKKISPSPEGFYSRYPAHFQTMQSGLQCRTFYKNHKQVKVLDFPALASEQIEQTMAGIYDFLGVDASYQNNMWHNKQNSYTRELLTKGISFNLNNETVEMGMAPVDLFFHHEKSAQPWVTIHDTQDIYALCPTLPKLEGDLVFMPKSVEAFNKLSFKTRKALSEGVEGILGEILPVWAANAERGAQLIKQTKLHTLNDEDRSFIAKMMKNDLDIFCRYHPEFKTLWDL